MFFHEHKCSLPAQIYHLAELRSFCCCFFVISAAACPLKLYHGAEPLGHQRAVLGHSMKSWNLKLKLHQLKKSDKIPYQDMRDRIFVGPSIFNYTETQRSTTSLVSGTWHFRLVPVTYLRSRTVGDDECPIDGRFTTRDQPRPIRLRWNWGLFEDLERWYLHPCRCLETSDLSHRDISLRVNDKRTVPLDPIYWKRHGGLPGITLRSYFIHK